MPLDTPPARGSAGLLELYTGHYGELVRLAVLLVDNPEQAEEVVQDAFARALVKGDQIDEPGPYIKRCVVNACHDILRRRRIERRLLPKLRHVDPPPEPDYLLDLVASLPPRERIAITLRYYGDMPVDAIAQMMGCPLGTAKTLLHRGAARLKDQLER